MTFLFLHFYQETCSKPHFHLPPPHQTTVRPSAPSDLDACIAYIKENLQAREREPMTKFSRRVRELNFGDSFYFRSIMTTDIDSTDADLALSVFNRAFCDPSEWTRECTSAMMTII